MERERVEVCVSVAVGLEGKVRSASGAFDAMFKTVRRQDSGKGETVNRACAVRSVL
jgi:hypothetical protein